MKDIIGAVMWLFGFNKKDAAAYIKCCDNVTLENILLCYYDKFHNFDEMAVKKLFSWAFMVRVDMENLGFDSINKYAIGDENNSRYTNTIAIFSKISFARLHTEVSSLQIKVKRDPDQAASSNWSELYSTIKEINGIMEVSHE